ncbi:hypothetical protein ACFYTQ_24795 [Nocardia sp. NPDC004068]|uniref:hypothetical protein n=1 Tax=Nocardia sp. NPDC004068 TaxID=3364303 RepID=UPI0036C8E10F
MLVPAERGLAAAPSVLLEVEAADSGFCRAAVAFVSAVGWLPVRERRRRRARARRLVASPPGAREGGAGWVVAGSRSSLARMLRTTRPGLRPSVRTRTLATSR